MKFRNKCLGNLFLLLSLLGGGIYSPCLLADELTVAVTSHFDFTLDELKREFERQTGHQVKIVPGASAFHYGQILDGAAYDIFLAEDPIRLLALEKQGLIIPDTRFTYAQGRLVLWSVSNKPLSPKVLQDKDFHFLAIANPRLAPYGKAAKEFLDSFQLWDEIQDQLIVGENIGQTYQFAISGDVDLALIAFSQIIYGNVLQAGSYWPVPENYYTPIEFQGGLLSNKNVANDFLQFMRSPQGLNIIRSNGFNVPI